MRWPTAGFSLIENLAALLVLSIGLLGAAALLASALGALRSSTQRQTAIVLADDMANRLLVTGTTSVLAGVADFESWRNEVAARLPGGEGRVTRVAGERVDVFTIDVGWDEPSLGTQHHAIAVALAP